VAFGVPPWRLASRFGKTPSCASIVGIDPTILSGGKDGHFGFRGMRERAARIGAKLTIM